MDDNASILTNAAALLERYKNEEQLIEMEMQCLRVRLDIIRDVVSSLTGKRVGRPRKPRNTDTTETAAEDAIQAFEEAAA